MENAQKVEISKNQYFPSKPKFLSKKSSISGGGKKTNVSYNSKLLLWKTRPQLQNVNFVTTYFCGSSNVLSNCACIPIQFQPYA